jgi:hypothetical protein
MELLLIIAFFVAVFMAKPAQRVQTNVNFENFSMVDWLTGKRM